MLSYSLPQDTNTASHIITLIPPPPPDTLASYFSSMVLKNNSNKDLSKKSSIFCTDSKKSIIKHNLLNAKIAQNKKPLHIVQDDQRLTINVMNTNNNSCITKKFTFTSMSTPIVVPVVTHRPLPRSPETNLTFTDNDLNNETTLPSTSAKPNDVINKKSSSRSFLIKNTFNKFKPRHKSAGNSTCNNNENVTSNSITSALQTTTLNDDSKSKKAVEPYKMPNDSVRFKDLIKKHFRNTANSMTSTLTSTGILEDKSVIKNGVKTKTDNLRTIISEAGENWTHYYMPLILIGDFDPTKTKKLIENFDSITGLYKNNKNLFSKSSTSNSAAANTSTNNSKIFNEPNLVKPQQTSPKLNTQPQVSFEDDAIPLFNLNIEEKYRPLTMSTISQSNSNKIYSSIASSTNNKEQNNKGTKNVCNQKNNSNNANKSNCSESNRTSNDDEKLLKNTNSYGGASGTDTGGSSDPSDPEQSNNRLIALKNEIDKTMNEINSFKNEVSFRIQNAVDSLTQFEYGKYIKTNPNININEPKLNIKNKLHQNSFKTNQNQNETFNKYSTTETAVNTDISMSNAIFKIKYDDEESNENLKEQTINDDSEQDNDDDLIAELDYEGDTDKSFDSNNSQRSIGCLTKLSNRFAFEPNEPKHKTSDRRILLTTPLPPHTLKPLIESPTDTSSNSKIPALTLISNSTNANKTKKQQEPLIKDNIYKYSPNPNITNNPKTSQNTKSKSKKNLKNDVYIDENDENNIHQMRKNFIRQNINSILREKGVNQTYSETSSSSNNTHNNLLPNLPKDQVSIKLLKQNSLNNSQNKTLFRSSISPTYLKKQKIKQNQKSLLKENYFEPINDKTDNDSTEHEIDYHSTLQREDRSNNKSKNNHQQPLIKLPVHDFSRKTSNASTQDNNFLLKKIPLKRSFTFQDGKNDLFIPRNYHHLYHQASRKNSDQNLDNYYNLHLFSHLNASSSFNDHMPYYKNVIKPKNRQPIFQTTSTTKNMSKSSLLGYHFNNSQKDNSMFMCNNNSIIDKRLESHSSKYMNIRDMRYSNNFNSSSRISRRTLNKLENKDSFILPRIMQHQQQQQKQRNQFSSSFINTAKQIKNEHRNFKYYDMNLNLNNILKTNPYQLDFSMETSEDEDKSELELSFLKSFHRPHSSLDMDSQIQNDEFSFDYFNKNIYEDNDDDDLLEENNESFKINTIKNSFMIPRNSTNIFQNRLNNLNLMNQKKDLVFDPNIPFTSNQYSKLTDDLFVTSSMQRKLKNKTRVNKLVTNSEAMTSKSPIRFPIMEKQESITKIKNKNFSPDQPIEKSLKSISKQTKYLINYPTSSFSESISNKSLINMSTLNTITSNNINLNNQSVINDLTNVNTNLNESSSSNLISIPFEPEQTDSTVILSEFRLS